VSPIRDGLTTPRLGSALGLSQPLSGFLANSSSTALFRAATAPDRNLQSVPLDSGRPPLSGRLAPLPLSTGVQRRAASDLVTCGFPDAHALERSSLVPPPAMGSLSTSPKTRFPVALDRR